MPCYCFSFAVRVRCDIYEIGFSRFILKFLDNLRLAGHGDVDDLIIVINIHALLIRRQIPDMAYRRYDIVIFPEISSDGLGLCGRLNNN